MQMTLKDIKQFMRNMKVQSRSTAGLHFSRELIKRMEIKGLRFAEITMHTGLGTFRPIEVEDLKKHKMDAEYFKIDEYACEIVNNAIDNGNKICAVGTTVLKSIESSITAIITLKRQMVGLIYSHILLMSLPLRML